MFSEFFCFLTPLGYYKLMLNFDFFAMLKIFSSSTGVTEERQW